MELVIQPEVEARIRRAIPDGVGVLPGSLPVVSFGDPGTAAVATVSLNPGVPDPGRGMAPGRQAPPCLLALAGREGPRRA
jgi:hypothetical protein